MLSDLSFETGQFGPRAILCGPWTDTMLPELLNRKITDLELNQGKGWRGADLAFLSALSHLKRFSILDFTIRDISPINCLHDLKSLAAITYCRTSVEFESFPGLEHCDFEWRPKSESLFECAHLETLTINGYKGYDTDPFEKLSNLEDLTLLNSPVTSLRGLGMLSRLRKLRLGGLRKLESLDGIEKLVNLEELTVDTCRSIVNINEVRSMSKLTKLHLINDGDIDSLGPISALTNLESLMFYDSTNILDGDLSFLENYRSLVDLSFQNRKHYSHRREHFLAYMRGR